MSTNNENWVYNHETPNSARILGTVSEVYDNVAIETGDEDENAGLLENHRIPTSALTTTNNGNELSTSVNIEFFDGSAVINNNRNPTRNQSGGPFLGRQFVMFWNDARTRFANVNPSNAVIREIVPQQQQQHEIVTLQQQNEVNEDNANANRVQRTADWRRNLNNFFSMLTLPNAFNFRIIANPNLPNDSLPTLPHQRASQIASTVSEERSALNERVTNIQRRASLIESNTNNNNNSNNAHNHAVNDDTASSSPRADENEDLGNDENANNANEDQHIASQLVIKFLTNFVRYVPFLFIVLLKFLHDHILSLIDIAVIQFVLFQINKSLCLQVSKLAQKNYYILLRDFLLVSTVVFLRFYAASGAVDPFGLLITPPNQYIPMLTTNENKQDLSETLATDATSLQITKTISFTVVLYFVIINDAILKLLTMLIKIAITMLPNDLLKPKSRVSFPIN